MKNPICLLFAIGFASCATPRKALIIVEEPKQEPRQEKTVAESKPVVPAKADDGLRMPDMFALPDEDKLRSAAPPEGSVDTTVITRPPAE